jgi:hypothetical protein
MNEWMGDVEIERGGCLMDHEQGNLKMERTLNRQSERNSSIDPLGSDATDNIARLILKTVADPKMHPSIPVKVARAIVNRQVPPSELEQLLDIINAKRHSRQIRSTGAYFVAAIKRIFQRHEVIW